MAFKQSILDVTSFLQSGSSATVTVTITTNAGAENLADYELHSGDQLAIVINADNKYSTMDLLKVVSVAPNKAY